MIPSSPSNSSFPNTSLQNSWGEYLQTNSIAYWVVKSLIAIVTIVGNGIVIYLIVRRRKLHTTDNWFILSLSLSDLFTGAYITPSEIFCDFFKVCIKNIVIRDIISNFLIISSICNLCALTLDRYIVILYPLRYKTLITSARVKQLIFLAWFVPLVIVIATMLPAMSPQFIAAERYITILWIVLITIIPSVTLVLIYLRIYIVVQKQQLATRKMHLSSAILNKSHDRQRSRDRSSVKVLGVVILFFVLCWQPSMYRAICESFRQCHVSTLVKQSARILILLNSAINFIVYALLKRDLRKEFIRMCMAVGRTFARDRSYSHNSSTSGMSASSSLSTTVRYLKQSSIREVIMLNGSHRSVCQIDLES